ncbi:unnamed protein product [Medioppia subpectinata]|uniref:Uncharacterized protein n=1 Tax=Medioppia subpectinata TaxID=1979941 RepID=A0A7R9KWD4_9ACAR|nr:unnamed protein product [Medioppia subpectinata]CAG2110738.1 unnamed protein product [Medioppia subpectinata]
MHTCKGSQRILSLIITNYLDYQAINKYREQFILKSIEILLTWILLGASIAAYSTVWTHLSQIPVSPIGAVQDLISAIIGQSSRLGEMSALGLQRLRDNRQIMLFGLIYVWLLSSLILTKCLTEFLLNTYIPGKPVPLVDSVDELVRATHLTVFQSLDKRDINNTHKSEQFWKVNLRGEKGNQLFNNSILNNRPVHRVKMIGQGRAVYVSNTDKCEFMRALNPRAHTSTAPNKYGLYFNVHYVSRTYRRHQFMLNKLITCVEMGLDIREQAVVRLLNEYIGLTVTRSVSVSVAADDGYDNDDQGDHHQINLQKKLHLNKMNRLLTLALFMLVIGSIYCQYSGGGAGNGQQGGGGSMRDTASKVGQAAWGVAKTAAQMTPQGQAVMQAKNAYDGAKKVYNTYQNARGQQQG